MLEFLQFDFMQRALLAGVLIAVVSSMLGVHLVLRRQTMMGDGLSHIAFGGIALGIFLGVDPLLAAIFFSVAATLGIQKIREGARLGGDVGIAIMFSAGLALAVVLISLAKGFNSDLFRLLFGSILTVTGDNLVLIGSLAAATSIFVAVFYRKLFHISFDEEDARACGVRVDLLNAAFMMMTALTIVISISIVGILLVASLMVVPAATAILLSRKISQTFYISALLSLLAVFSGLLQSFYLDIAAGGAIVLTAVAVFLIVSLARGLKGR